MTRPKVLHSFDTNYEWEETAKLSEKWAAADKELSVTQDIKNEDFFDATIQH